MINPDQMKGLIKRVLQKIDLYSSEAVEFIYNIGLVESKYIYIQQISGPAVGVFQIEPWVGVDIIENYLKYRQDLMKVVASTCYLDWSYFTAPKENDWEYILTTHFVGFICAEYPRNYLEHWKTRQNNGRPIIIQQKVKALQRNIVK